jgi:osmoprotectant transport system permease protein
MLNYFSRSGDRYGAAVIQHLWVSGLALFFACLIGIPLGILCARSKRLRAIITGIFATLRIIPSLAVLLLCIPIIGTGVKPAIVALCFLAISPLLINTTLAFSSIPMAVLETARGIGMSAARVFFLVKIPLAFPLVLTGFKTAVVEVIASATIAAYIGGGGLGTIIFTGLQLMRSDLLLIGGVSVAIISIFADYLLGVLEVAVRKSLFGEVR